MRGPLAVLLALAAPLAAAEPPTLSLPVGCRLGTECHIQQYVDRDPGPGATDHRCGTLSYDGHKGTDFRLPDLAAMARGVEVRAAAEGVVEATRDGMPDRTARRDDPAIAGRDCGNGVLLTHPGGWQTQYCHLARGSVAVARGESVARGQRLGRIGLSGATEFPHLHLTLRDPEGTTVDPFDGRAMDAPCGAGGAGLWAEPVPYAPGGALSAGMLDRVPDYDEVKAGTAARPAMPPDAPAVVFWAHFYGLAAGDVILLRLEDPDGRPLAEDRHEMPRARAAQFRAVGLRARAAWPPGTYRGEGRLLRGGREIAGIAAAVEIGR